MNTNLAFLNWLLLLWSYLADSNYIPTQIASEQHYSWCTLGFVRAVATSPVICEALSSQKWIDLLLKILEEEKPSQPTKNIIKQVRGHCTSHHSQPKTSSNRSGVTVWGHFWGFTGIIQTSEYMLSTCM